MHSSRLQSSTICSNSSNLVDVGWTVEEKDLKAEIAADCRQPDADNTRISGNGPKSSVLITHRYFGMFR